jgi:hypothetical protein
MNRRRVTLGAAAGGLLGAALVPAAIAVADNYNIVRDPGSIETITGFYGPDAPPPSVPTSFQGYQLFDVVDTTTGKTVGTFYGDEAYTSSLYGSPNLEVLVTSDVSGPVGTAVQDVPPVGSVIEEATNTTGGETIYSDRPSATGDVITQTVHTTYGNTTSAGFFDAAKGIANHTVDADRVPLANGDYIVVHPGSQEVFTGIDGDPPTDVAVQGDQEFDIDNAHGVTVGTFDADVTNTSDFAGNYTEALVVTDDLSGTPGTAANDVLPVDSVINVFYYPNSDEQIYLDVPTPSGDVATTTQWYSPSWYTTSPSSFDAIKALATQSFVVPGKYDIVPASPLEVAGINGLPPSDVTIQGYQQFIVENPTTHAQVGIIDADVDTDAYAYGNPDEAFLVTSDVSGTPGTVAGDVPPVGSVFDVVNEGNGYESIYSDLASQSGDMISQYAVSPTGDTIGSSTSDLAAGLAFDHFFVPAF